MNLVQRFGHRPVAVTFQECAESASIELTAREPEVLGGAFGGPKEFVGDRDGGLHGWSITRVIPTVKIGPRVGGLGARSVTQTVQIVR